MDDELLRKSISVLVNRSNTQSKELFELCERDIDTYIRVETLISLRCSSFVPADKETLMTFLLSELGTGDADFEKKFYFESSRFYSKDKMYSAKFVLWLMGKQSIEQADRMYEKYLRESSVINT